LPPADPAALDRGRLQAELNRLCDTGERLTGQPVTSAQSAVFVVHEGFKAEIWAHGRAVLAADTWSEAQIGSGALLDRLRAAIRIRAPQSGVLNNLVDWGNNQRGADDTRLLTPAAQTGPARHRLEAALFALYVQDRGHAQVFEALADAVERRWPLPAYALFLSNRDRCLPLRAKTFQAVFDRLDIPLKLWGRCGWETYLGFCARVDIVHTALNELEFETPTRLDAHSVLWLMGRIDEMLDRQVQAGGRDRTLVAHVMSIKAYEAQIRTGRGGMSETRARKAIAFEFADEAAMAAYLVELWARQAGQCCLTGLPMALGQPKAVGDQAVSVDRIDSAAGYAPGNLQLVCHFANLWKSDSDDAAFRALLAKVRAVAPPDSEA